ncbi:MAG: hypothetical protein U9N59_04310 [Campylobacterota bacterium]|nr:hypothetical protein [Campylobacterota bacterium]
MRINKKYTIWIIANILLFIVISYILNRSMFDSEVDKFYGQMQNIYNQRDLGILNLFYSIRYYTIYPFFQIKHMQLPNILEYFTLILYLSPILFFTKLPIHIRYFSILLIYMSLFFSYRTVLVSVSIYMLIIHIKYIHLSKKYIFISFLYSFLSSGTFLLWLMIVLFYKKTLISSKKYNKFINLSIILLVLLLSGPIAHKLLFFLNQDSFGGVVELSILDALGLININDLIIIMNNIFERSLIYEAYETNNYIRLVITGFEVFLSILLFLFTKKVLSLVILLLLTFSLLFEGLMIYSLLFSIVVLFHDYLFRQYKKNRNYKLELNREKNIIS